MGGKPRPVGFPDATIRDVLRAVAQARDAVTLAELGSPQDLDAAESIARQDLVLITGPNHEVVRLDPERRRC